MLFAQSILLFLTLCASSRAQSESERQQDESVLGKVGCGAVNFLVTGFLPQAHATAFCSAYLQVPEHTYTSTATVTASASTVTETISQIVPTLTRTVSRTVVSTTTKVIDLWSGRPACSTPPSFSWINEPQRGDSFKSTALVEQACRCLQVPASTVTVGAETTITPTSTITKGITGRTEVTSTKTHTAVETETKFIFLVDQPQHNSSEESVTPVRRNVPSMVERGPVFDYNKSSLIESNETQFLYTTMPPLDTVGSENKLRLALAS